VAVAGAKPFSLEAVGRMLGVSGRGHEGLGRLRASEGCWKSGMCVGLCMACLSFLSLSVMHRKGDLGGLNRHI